MSEQKRLIKWASQYNQLPPGYEIYKEDKFFVGYFNGKEIVKSNDVWYVRRELFKHAGLR